ncbi:MAG: hypothetical protein M1820_007186 [Bogoriella megaspora]|nr:MAG: hypothetical protein M1820_007186 [Bogoriella megaspora]
MDPQMSSLRTGNNMATAATGGHMMAPDDPDSPMNWPLYRRLYTSMAAFAFAFSTTFGATAYTVGLKGVATEFGVEPHVAVLGFSVYLFGIFFAPIYTPHISERVGRTPVYFVGTFLSALFIIGAGWTQSFASLIVTRFFAGFFAGPNVVLIEGTFADIWAARTTNTYYAFLGFAQYFGAACGPLILGFIVPVTSWRWTQYITLMIQAAVLLFAIGVPETYQREIIRRRARRAGLPHGLAPAASGTTLIEMARHTLINPIIMLYSEPIVIGITLYLGLCFGIVFQWFITVPAVLNMVYDYTLQQIGLAFISAIIGSVMAALTSILIEQIVVRILARRNANLTIENRLIPAMIGGFFILASLFWVGNTAAPTFNSLVPITGTGVYVYGNLLVIISLIPYIFDAYLPQGTLSALTAMACFRLAMAGVVPLVILQFFMNATGK